MSVTIPMSVAISRVARRPRIAVRVALCVVLLAASVRGQAQSPAPPASGFPAAPASTWVEAVDTYAAGEYLAAVLRATQIDANELLTQGRRDAEGWRREGSDVARRRLRAAAALAFELGLLQLDTPAGPGRSMEIGETSLRALERTAPDDGTFGAIWRLGQLHLLLFSRQADEVDGRARRDDVKHLPPALQAEWHVARGIAFETAARLSLGASRVQQTPFGTSAVPRQLWVDRNLRSALEHYEAALAADETHLETRVRLGRVLLEQGKPAQARPHLERAATERCLEVVCGLGWLFLGEWHMSHGTPEGARRAYVRASSVLDLRQSALFGLLASTMQTRPALAIGLTRQFDARAMLGRRDEPDAWSRYITGHPFGLMTVLQAMREDVGK